MKNILQLLRIRIVLRPTSWFEDPVLRTTFKNYVLAQKKRLNGTGQYDPVCCFARSAVPVIFFYENEDILKTHLEEGVEKFAIWLRRYFARSCYFALSYAARGCAGDLFGC